MKRLLSVALAAGFVLLAAGSVFAQAKGDVPSYVKDPKNAVWTVLGKKPFENGIALVYKTGEGDNKPVTAAGKDGWSSGENPASQDGARYMYFNITDMSFKKSKSPKVDIIVEYLDKDSADIGIAYDSSDKDFTLVPNYPEGTWKPTEDRLTVEDSGKWKTMAFRIEDARFENNCNGCDFRFEIPGGFDFIISSLAVVRVK